MKKIIAALHMSLDGYIEDANGDSSWIESWGDDFGVIPRVDTLLLGRAMYPGYEQYWGAVHDRPTQPAPFTGRIPGPEEVEYAAFAVSRPHVVLSTTMTEANWPNTRIIRDIAEVRRMKEDQGLDVHAVGGARLIGSLLNAGLVDELMVVVQPILLGGGKALFGHMTDRHRLSPSEVKPMAKGALRLTYDVL
jgi:dihydrofolate reductase